MEPYNCFACGSGLRKGERRFIGSPSTQHILPLLCDVARRTVAEKDTECQLDETRLQSGYICRSCFRELEKLQKLQKQVQSIQEHVYTNAKQALPYLPTLLSSPNASQSDVAATELETSGSSIAGSSSNSRKRSPSGTPKGRKMRRMQMRDIRHRPVVHGRSVSPAVAVTVFYKKKPRSYYMTPSRSRICRPLIRRSRCALARRCLQDRGVQKYITKGIGCTVQHEVASLCSDKVNFVLRDKSAQALETFSWETITEQMKTQAPTLLCLLEASTRTRKPRKNRKAIIGLIAAILCRHRRPTASLLQRLLSIVLYTGHASKRVYQRLQKLHLSLSHRQTLNVLDSLGEGYDAQVRNWKKEVEEAMDSDFSKQIAGNATTIVMNTIHSADNHDEDNYMSSTSSSDIDRSIESSDLMVGFQTSTPVKATMMAPFHASSSDCDDGSQLSLVSMHSSLDSDTVMAPDFSLLTSAIATEESNLQSSHDSQTITVDKADGIQPMVKGHSRPGYKLVIDNIDKNVKPRDMRLDAQTKSLHYVHAYSVKDRVDFSSLSDVPRSAELKVDEILPSTEDYKKLKENFSVLVARIMIENLSFFSEDFQGLITHVPHAYSMEMAKKSEVVPMGVLPKDEISYEDMISILEHLQCYVPSKQVQREVTVPGTDEILTVEDHKFCTTLIGGDQLTVARARGAQLIRSNSENRLNGLAGLLPVVEDWHSKQCLLEVIWNRLYKTRSGMERGTLYQLRNLINRRNVTTSCKDDMNACEDFFELVVTGHILVATMEFMGMSSVDDVPLQSVISPDVWMLSNSERASILRDAAAQVVDKHVDLSLRFSTSDSVNTHGTVDTVYAYACETLSLGLLYFEFRDAIKEGDGERVLLVWKFLLLLFKASQRKNYAIEAFTLLAQYHLILPPHLAEQLKWSRFVNVHGLPGHNISCDLHLEHLNRLVKTAIEGLGANKSEKAIIRVGRCIGTLAMTMENYDKQHHVPATSGSHSKRSSAKDLKKIVQQLQQVNVFEEKNGRMHRSFKNMKANLITTIDESKLNNWMVAQFSKILTK